MGRRFVVAVVLGSILASCASEPIDGPAAPPNPVTGLILAIEGNKLVLEFGGNSTRFTIADPSVPLEHLEVHRRDRLPVRITWEGDQRAVKIEDG